MDTFLSLSLYNAMGMTFLLEGQTLTQAHAISFILSLITFVLQHNTHFSLKKE